MIFPTSLQVLAHTDELTTFATYQVFQTNPGKRRIAVGERHIHIISYKNEKESPNVSSHVSVHCVFCAFLFGIFRPMLKCDLPLFPCNPIRLFTRRSSLFTRCIRRLPLPLPPTLLLRHSYLQKTSPQNHLNQVKQVN